MTLKQRIITAIVLLAMLATTIMSAANAIKNNSHVDFIISTSEIIEPTTDSKIPQTCYVPRHIIPISIDTTSEIKK